jgi:hypothetical protein
MLVGLAGWLNAEEVLREIQWTDVGLPADVALTAEGDVHFQSRDANGSTATLLEIEAPGITKNRYALSGRVRYENVAGDGYLEIWSDFGEEGKYFTRTLGDSGPLQKLTGSAPARDFALFFDSSGASAPPRRLTMNVVLPGTGEVWVSALTLMEFEDDEWPLGADPGGPGSSRSVGLWGGLAGALLGIWGALLGTLGGRGKAKGFVLFGLRAMQVAGVVALALGIVALLRGGSGEMIYTLLLLGVIAVVVSSSVTPALRRRYEELELRRMQALDA